jgi:hypothetical protein
MWLRLWTAAPATFYGAEMTGKTKLEARRRAREAQARANEDRATRERENVEDAATYVVAVDKLREIDAWETARLAAVCEQVRHEANKRRTEHRTAAHTALTRMQHRGGTLTLIAELTGAGFAEIRAVLRYAVQVESRTATGIAVGVSPDGGSVASLTTGATPTPPADVESHGAADRQTAHRSVSH